MGGTIRQHTLKGEWPYKFSSRALSKIFGKSALKESLTFLVSSLLQGGFDLLFNIKLKTIAVKIFRGIAYFGSPL